MKILSVYPNCSLGGMSTVYRNRILFEGGDEHLLVFTNDAGGKPSFEGLPRTHLHITRKDGVANYVHYSAKLVQPDQLRVTSIPSLPEMVHGQGAAHIIYEFHTSNEGIIADEIKKLALGCVDEFWTPSRFLEQTVARMLPPQHRDKLSVRANLVDTDTFSPTSSRMDSFRFGGRVPLLWVGRFDKGKNPKDFVRIISMLPSNYVGIFVVSLEGDSERSDDFLSEAFLFGVQDRIRLFMNLSPEQMGDLYRAVSKVGGIYCSTSLGESFGYSVAEGLGAGVRVVAYDVGAIGEFASSDLHLVGVGELGAFVERIRDLC